MSGVWSLTENQSKSSGGSSPVSKQQLGLPSKITREGALVEIENEHFMKVILAINISTQDHHLFTQCLKSDPKLYPTHKIQNTFLKFAYLSL